MSLGVSVRPFCARQCVLRAFRFVALLSFSFLLLFFALPCFFLLLPLLHSRMECCSVRGQYRPNRTPGTKCDEGVSEAGFRMQCLRICGKCRAAFRRVACCASALSSYRSTITRLPSGTSPSQLHAIFAPSALFPGISRRCTWRSVASTQAQRRYRASSLP